jgi:triphosphoribosyl-dephospho-CoA synthase
LLKLIAEVDDTNVVARGGLSALRTAQAAAREALLKKGENGDITGLARRLDSDFTARRISPGGCADLLAAALYVRSLTSL